MTILVILSLLIVYLYAAPAGEKKISVQEIDSFPPTVLPEFKRAGCTGAGNEKMANNTPQPLIPLHFQSGIPASSRLNLAIELCRMALPLWDLYISDQSSTRNKHEAGMKVIPPADIITEALDELASFANSNVRTSETSHKSYSRFIKYILALKDATWTPPYPVKKLFLSVHILLRSIGENNLPGNDVMDAVSDLIECLELSDIPFEKEMSML